MTPSENRAIAEKIVEATGTKTFKGRDEAVSFMAEFLDRELPQETAARPCEFQLRTPERTSKWCAGFFHQITGGLHGPEMAIVEGRNGHLYRVEIAAFRFTDRADREEAA